MLELGRLACSAVAVALTLIAGCGGVRPSGDDGPAGKRRGPQSPADGQALAGNGELETQPQPVEVTGLSDAVEIAAGKSFTCARRTKKPEAAPRGRRAWLWFAGLFAYALVELASLAMLWERIA